MPEKSNSLEPKQKIISGSANQRKAVSRSRLADLFIKEDVESVMGVVVSDMIIPGIKYIFLDSLSMILTGEPVSRGRRSGGGTVRRSDSKTSYEDYYKREERTYNARNLRDGMDIGSIVVETRGDAELVMDYLIEQIDRYGVATVGDLYDAVGITMEYTSRGRDYGWTTAEGFRKPYRVRDGYVLDLPKPERIN